jgi:hypothetical protein
VVKEGKMETEPIKVRQRIFWTQWGEWAREILRQYDEAGYNHCASLPFHGPHYVTYEHGQFYLRPYGAWAEYRYWFECRPEFLPGREEALWTFVVMC